MTSHLLSHVGHVSYVGHMNLLTARQAADKLGVPVRTFNRWVAAGRFVPVTQAPGVRGARLFAVADIEAAA